MSSFFNRVKFSSSTSGTADFGVGAAVQGFVTPGTAGVSDGTPISYTAFSSDGSQWETGHGTYHTAGPTISRDTVLDTTSGFGVKVNFSANPTVQIDLLAQDLAENIIGISGNTSGVTTTFSSATVYLAGGNNVTLSQNSNSITISAGGGGAGDGYNIVSASGNTSGTLTTFSTGTIVLAGGNNVTLSQSSNSITISGPNTVAQSNQTIGFYATGNTIGGAATSLTLDARSVTLSGGGQGFVGFLASQIIIDASGDGVNIVSIGGNTSGTKTTFSTGTVLLAGGNNITLSQSSNSITISAGNAAGDGVNVVSASGNTSGTLTTFSTGTIVLAGGNNVTLSQSSNTITISAANAPAQTNQTLGLYAVGNTTTQSSSTTVDARSLSFDGAGNVSVGMSGGSVIISGGTAAGDGINVVSASGNTSGTLTTFSTGTIVLAGGNNITLSQSSNTITISGASRDGVNIVSASGNTSGTLTTFSTGTIVFAGGNNITLSQSSNTITISGPNTAAQSIQTYNVVSASGNTSGTLTSFSTGTIVLAGGNNITLSQSSDTITISGPNTAAQTNQTLGLYAVGNTTTQSTSTTVDARSLSFDGAGIASVGMSNGSVVISVPSGGGVVTLSAFAVGNTTGQSSSTTLDQRSISFDGAGNISVGFSGGSAVISGPLTYLSAYDPFFGGGVSSVANSLAQNSLYVFPIILPSNLTISRFNMFGKVQLSSGATASQQVGYTLSMAVYTRATGTTNQLSSIFSSSITGAVSMNSNASIGFSWGGVTASSAGIGMSSNISGNSKLVTVPMATSLSPGEYWIAIANSSSSVGSGAAFSISMTQPVMSTAGGFLDPIEITASASLRGLSILQGWGAYSVTSGAFPGTISISELSQQARGWYFNFQNVNTS